MQLPWRCWRWQLDSALSPKGNLKVPPHQEQEGDALKLSGSHPHNLVLKWLRMVELCGLYYHHNSDENTIYISELSGCHQLNSLRILARILSSENLTKTIAYFLEYGAATDLILQHRTRLSGQAVRWARKELYTMQLIEPATRLPKDFFAKGGPRVKVWQLDAALPGQIRDAMLLHQRLQSPKYRVAVEVAQSLLDGYLRAKKEITYREIVLQVKSLKLSFNTPDIADLTAQYLHEQGVRIWR